MILGQIKSIQNFRSFGPQRAEKHNFWREKSLTLTLRFPSLHISQNYFGNPSLSSCLGFFFVMCLPKWSYKFMQPFTQGINSEAMKWALTAVGDILGSPKIIKTG